MSNPVLRPPHAVALCSLTVLLFVRAIPVLTPGSAALVTNHLRESTDSLRYVSREAQGDTVERTIAGGRREERLTRHERGPALLLVSSSTFDVLLRSIPLREGYEAILPLYSEGSDELEMDTVRVVGRNGSGVWTLRFAGPAIVAILEVNGATRQQLSYARVLRKTGNVMRRESVPMKGGG